MDREEQDLDQAISRIWEIASGFGLDPFTIRFEMVPAQIMYEFGAYGLPSRFSHWTVCSFAHLLGFPLYSVSLRTRYTSNEVHMTQHPAPTGSCMTKS